MGGAMSSIQINGDTSGSVILQAPSVAGSTTLTLPSTSGTVLTTTSGQWITTGSDIYYNTGNVGIGTTTPGTKVQVYNSGSTDTRFSIGNANAGFQFGVESTGACLIANFVAQPISMYTNGSERMRIDSSGNMLVGTTSNFASGSVQGIAAQASGNASLALNRTTDTGAVARFYQAGTNVGRIDVTGAATSYVTSSDYRLKENVAPMTGALDKVAQLKPVTYTWKSDGSNGQGFIAHELQAVIPECVTGEKDAVNEDGSIDPQGIDTSFLVATLTAAIQELKAELDELKAKIG